MDRNIKNSQAAFEAACTERGYDAAAILPDVSAVPEWLGRYTHSTIKRVIIAEAINNGRVRKPGKETVYFPVWDLTTGSAGFGFSYSDYGLWLADTGVGPRLEFFSREDADYFGKNFMDLHQDILIVPGKE